MVHLVVVVVVVVVPVLIGCVGGVLKGNWEVEKWTGEIEAPDEAVAFLYWV